MTVPDGTTQDVLDWVGNDSARAQEALDHENCQDTPRTTLTSKLETIAAQGAAQEGKTVSETQTTDPEVGEGAEVELAPAPERPAIDEMEFDPRDNAIFVGPANVANPEVDIPDDSYDKLAAVSADEEDAETVSGTPVDFFQVMGGGGAVILRFDGTVIALDADQTLALVKDLRQALAGVTY